MALVYLQLMLGAEMIILKASYIVLIFFSHDNSATLYDLQSLERQKWSTIEYHYLGSIWDDCRAASVGIILKTVR